MSEWFWQEQYVRRGEVEDRVRKCEGAEKVECADALGEEWEEEERAAHAEEALKHENDADAGGWESEAADELERQVNVLFVLFRKIWGREDEREQLVECDGVTGHELACAVIGGYQQEVELTMREDHTQQC